jgi:hypothetical protein
MFKSFTSSDSKLAAKGAAGSSPAPAPPETVSRAVRFMFAGAAASLVWGLYLVIVTLTSRSAALAANNSLTTGRRMTPSQFNSAYTGIIVYYIAITLVFVALWLWMARMNQAGRNWARITASVLFAIWTYEAYRSITALSTWIVFGLMIIMLLIWGAGLGALYYLWRPESKAYFKPPTP